MKNELLVSLNLETRCTCIFEHNIELIAHQELQVVRLVQLHTVLSVHNVICKLVSLYQYTCVSQTELDFGPPETTSLRIVIDA